MKKIVELLIDWENLEFDDLGVDVMSIVDKPAIGVNFLKFAHQEFVEPESGESEDDFVSRCIPVLKGEGYDDDQAAAICYSSYIDQDFRENPDCPDGFEHRMPDGTYMCGKEHNFETYNDYPKAARENAQRAIDYANENGWGSCGTPVGKARANQLAKGENISEETISRMAAFERHRNNQKPYSEGCGKLMWDSWGGDEGVAWAQRKLKSIKQQKMEEAVLKLAKKYGETLPIDDTVYIDTTKTDFVNVGDYLKGIIGLDILGKQDLDNEPEIKYRYTGPISSDSRNFCRAMVRLNKIYTRDEINDMDTSINTGFRHDGQPYSIFDFKGGVNCEHYWEELEVYKEGRSTVVMSKGRASGQAGRIASASNNYWRYPGSFQQFAFSEDDERIVVGPAMIPDQLIVRQDELGKPFHVFFSRDTVKKIAEKFFEYSKQNNTDINHDDEITTQNTLLESWIVANPEMDKAKDLGFNVPEGTWMTSYKINNDETWNKIKAGELNGYSIAGNFIEKATQR